MSIRQIRKNISRKNLWLVGVVMSGVLGNSVAFAADLPEYEDIDNSNAYNTIVIDDDSVTFNNRTASSVRINGRTYNYTGRYSGSLNAGSGSANVAYNSLTINGGQFGLRINGGNFGGNFYANDINLAGGTLGLEMNALNYSGAIANNIFSITGGTFANSYNNLSSAEVTGNTFEISGSPNISGAYIYAGFFGAADTASGNTLNYHSNGLSARNIYNFDTLNFYLPSGVSNGDTLLTLTDGETDLSGASINAYVDGGTGLNPGDSVNLIVNPNGLTTNGSGTVTVDEGITLHYDGSVVAQDGDNLVLTLGTPSVEEKTKALSQGIVSADKTVARGTERVIDWLPPDEFEEAAGSENFASQVAAIVNKSFGVFANMSGTKLKSKTGGGSYIQTKGGGFDLGLARAVESQSGGTWIFAPLIDYGKNDFDTYLSDGTHGSGNSKYFSGGLIGRKMLNSGLYYEASLRGGRSTTDFSSRSLAEGTSVDSVSYHASAPVFAGHLRLGKLLRMNKNNVMHMYGIYAHNHINGINTTLSSGEHYNFSAVDSGTFRLGYRLTTRVSPLSRIYTGLAYQYEFNGSTDGEYRNYTTPEAEVKGSSGMLELGWQIKADKRTDWMVDFNVTGWAGMQKGLGFSGKVKKSF